MPRTRKGSDAEVQSPAFEHGAGQIPAAAAKPELDVGDADPDSARSPATATRPEPSPDEGERFDGRLPRIIQAARTLDAENDDAFQKLEVRHQRGLHEEDKQFKAETNRATKKITAVRDTLTGVKGALAPFGHPPHPVLAEIHPTSTAFERLDNPEQAMTGFVAAVEKARANGDFISYSPPSIELRILYFVVPVGVLGLVFYFITRDTWMYPGPFIGLVIWSLFVGGVVSYTRLAGRGEKYWDHYATLAQAVGDAEGGWLIWDAEIRGNHARRLRMIADGYRRDKEQLEQTFGERRAELRERLRTYVDDADSMAPSWADPVWQESWWEGDQQERQRTTLPTLIRLGTRPFTLGGANLTIPVLARFPSGVSLLVKTSGGNKQPALDGIRSVMLSLLTQIPPGKLRFTLIDPVGLGQNVASFMHLADHDDSLVTIRAWTEPQHIEQRLTDLSEHMETVIQKYLRNKYPSMEDYNRQAEMVAEPYRVLVVASFPVNFTESAAKRLVSIATNGPRCGVYTLIMVDTEQPLPHGFNLADLERVSTVIRSEADQFRLAVPELDDRPLAFDRLPPLDLVNHIVNQVGRDAKRASGVQVPFARVVPERQEWWTKRTSAGIETPIGLSGASKRQLLALGEGTAQHVLIAGRTGSGKSTLLHVMIANLAATYSPDELELYLIDFKKGVEFKTYAPRAVKDADTGRDSPGKRPRLPHARVIAIESEREFGLSVLQKLDAELTHRGSVFREVADQLGIEVPNIAIYRKRTGQPLPRILLIVDEFQEFFVEEDALANQVGLILDRLVRQGRSFGIHVVLGSQTLAGTYALNRTTMDQMGIRIALQCSEADSRLILSDDNPAARLLSRPGEAIYNDANGMMEGNDPFQTVWLSDDERERHLDEVCRMASERDLHNGQPQIVFEGQELARPEQNKPLAEALAAAAWPPLPATLTAWLGDSVAIKPPTAASFRRQAGSNLLIVGQDETAATGMMSAIVLSLAAQYPPGDNGVRFVVLDLTQADSPHADVLSTLLQPLPHERERFTRRGVTKAVEEVAAEVERRMERDESGAPVFLLIHGLMRARDLRPSEDHGSPFSFGSYGASEAPRVVTPHEQFAKILREGPEVGVHVVVWSDTFGNLQRTLDRAALREFDLRVVFQMGADDSSALIDTPAASRLGPHRAFAFSEEQAHLEKFRPFAQPDQEWLRRMSAVLADRGGKQVKGRRS